MKNYLEMLRLRVVVYKNAFIKGRDQEKLALFRLCYYFVLNLQKADNA